MYKKTVVCPANKMEVGQGGKQGPLKLFIISFLLSVDQQSSA